MHAYSPLLVVTALLVGWLALFLALALLGGWRALAKRFPAKPFIPAKFRLCPVVWLGHSGPSYRQLVFVGFSDAGVSVRSLVIVPFHPPLFMPWSEVTWRRSKDWFWGESRELILAGEEDGVHLLLSSAAVADMARFRAEEEKCLTRRQSQRPDLSVFRSIVVS